VPRRVRNAKLDTPSARAKLAPRREPYWTVLVTGCAIGYRKLARARGTWIARFRDDRGKQRYSALGPADDINDPASGLALSYGAAQEKAREWFKRAARGFDDQPQRTGPYTVKDACTDYVADYASRGGKSVAATRATIDAFVLPVLGDIALAKLSKSWVKKWRDELAERPARLRTKRGKAQRHRLADMSTETQRRRRATANRILTVLKAVLNHARREGHVHDDAAWHDVRPFREVGAARVRYLSDKEATRLVNACTAGFRKLVTAGLLSGCRYGELTTLLARDYSPDSGTIHIRASKSGKPRHVVLTDEGKKFFARAVVGKGRDDLILTHDDGRAWNKSEAQRPMADACKSGKIKPAITFHELRHTYASRLVMRGAPLMVVAQQLGHSDTRMVEKHYGHLAPSYVADTVRSTFGTLGIVEADNVVPLAAQ
jgi:integrase